MSGGHARGAPFDQLFRAHGTDHHELERGHMVRTLYHVTLRLAGKTPRSEAVRRDDAVNGSMLWGGCGPRTTSPRKEARTTVYRIPAHADAPRPGRAVAVCLWPWTAPQRTEGPAGLAKETFAWLDGPDWSA